MLLVQSSRNRMLPESFEILSEEDKCKYCQLRKMIHPLTVRTTRDQLAIKFYVMVGQIQQYSVRNDADDWKRCLVCGVVWLDGAIAISTRQLRMLIGKCKSSINAGFQSLGYTTVPMTSQYASHLTSFFPFFVQNGNEVRQWTMRARSESNVKGSSPLSCGPCEWLLESTEDGINGCELSCEAFREQEWMSETEMMLWMQLRPGEIERPALR
jgi:hypothetical protein